MADEFTAIIGEMIKTPPDPNEPVPLANQKGTMFGVTIPFHVLCWIFVAFRLHTRLRVVREPGLDDLFVVLAAAFNLVSLVTFLYGTKYGMGHHLIYSFSVLQPTMIWLYITNAAYHTTTAFIKISLLLQYLRLFREGTRRTVSIVLLALVVTWGLTFSFMAWVPCFPVSGFWDRSNGAKCYGFGYRTVNEAKYSVLSFAATNMLFDIAIFLVPLTEYFRPDLRRKQVLAMTGLFALGSIVVLMAILRLWSTFKHSQSKTQSFDFTWWYPEVLIISCLEVDFAIMCASMPIFWPTVIANWSHIFVTNEVRVTHHQRLADDSRDNFELVRNTSLKSVGSVEGLARASGEQQAVYNGFDPETGKDGRFAIMQVEVQPHAQESRRL
ncbi:hypothetical protein CC77DRAFT_570393 [Alternaria alternata]|uniref:Rhodopsin domain-containing protein n=2 Tax=Alternaria sect. Alternaria TaxID=2499237 RepID=A0A177D505_ALTAL|nr:hypothetical protein CC77DRAFT_570393 [Alternaria alternata]OAG14317.1 hypothetical protein CC77DRAFT_570393 [Alternaria alternata]RYN51124.1 hypothetical protein AA0118_g10627 [Alternaria tenuissima]RYN71443.1 hypothetical protein AA0117_g9519 [Alternaria alternata]